MTDAVLGNIVAMVGTIAGVVLGYLLSRAQAKAARKGELHSLLDAARWELMDTKNRAQAGPSALPFPLPALELVVQQGMLAELPLLVRQRLLQTRTVVTLHNERNELLLRWAAQAASSWDEVMRQLAAHGSDPKGILPLFELCLAALEDHLNRLTTGWVRRLWNWLCRRKTTSATPRA